MKSLSELRQEKLGFLAFAVLKHRGKQTDLDSVLKESARIERVISAIYEQSRLDIDYNQFILTFIKKNGEEFVYGDTWDYDIKVPDESFEMDVNVLIDKFDRKQNGAKY